MSKRDPNYWLSPCAEKKHVPNCETFRRERRRRGSACPRKPKVKMNARPGGAAFEECARVDEHRAHEFRTLVERIPRNLGVADYEFHHFRGSSCPGGFRSNDSAVVLRLNMGRESSGKRGSIQNRSGQSDGLYL